MAYYDTQGRNINDLCKEFFNSGYTQILSVPDAVLRWQNDQGYLFSHVSCNWWAIAQDIEYRYVGDIDIQNRFATGEITIPVV